MLDRMKAELIAKKHFGNNYKIIVNNSSANPDVFVILPIPKEEYTFDNDRYIGVQRYTIDRNTEEIVKRDIYDLSF